MASTSPIEADGARRGPPILTAGYEGLASRDFIAFLRGEGVARVIDIRALPLSRKPGFSKRQLAASVEEAGMAYTHLRALGTPKSGRDAARRGDAAGLDAIYTAHLAGEDATHALAEAAVLVGSETCCLLCFEAGPECCHRRIVAERLAMGGQAVRHLRLAPGGMGARPSPGRRPRARRPLP